jgi:hypothetical protein
MARGNPDYFGQSSIANVGKQKLFVCTGAVPSSEEELYFTLMETTSKIIITRQVLELRCIDVSADFYLSFTVDSEDEQTEHIQYPWVRPSATERVFLFHPTSELREYRKILYEALIPLNISTYYRVRMLTIGTVNVYYHYLCFYNEAA